MDFPLELLQTLRIAHRVVALTGAGVSQESGLRTFRDAHPSTALRHSERQSNRQDNSSGQAGLWVQYRPEDLASPEAFARNPKLVWDWYAWRREAVKSVRPNPGHVALAEMAHHVPEFTLITQNVDGLHRMAEKSLKVVETYKDYPILELHGNIQRVRCAECGAFTETWSDDTEQVPRCAVCGGMLRPDVVWFGESLPRSELEAAVEAARKCDVFFSIGTSGVVQPAASLAFAAHNQGAVVAEVNLEPTPLTSKADYFLQGKSGEVLPELVKAVWG